MKRIRSKTQKYLENLEKIKDIPLTPGQDYAVKYLASKGFRLISTPLILSRGNLLFEDPNGLQWGIYKRGGYIRKRSDYGVEWAVVDRAAAADEYEIEDDQYMDLAELLAMKYNALNAKKAKTIEKYGEIITKVDHKIDVIKYKDGLRCKDNHGVGSAWVPIETIENTIKELQKEGFIHISIIGDNYEDNCSILVVGFTGHPKYLRKEIKFDNTGESKIGFKKITKKLQNLK